MAKGMKMYFIPCSGILRLVKRSKETESLEDQPRDGRPFLVEGRIMAEGATMPAAMIGSKCALELNVWALDKILP
ncbi:hypothetical protein TNCT_42091 [Trichonephila clavata]|uniref:Uncharacterized protein n=1 Tax=Trichonephila clavata TaxID=2740835 RepID=A0A8X6HSW1_TRICU|nr:hypothetical protein TNCT_42091 [Trichonephila clavata]